jgi:hypothetical protein
VSQQDLPEIPALECDQQAHQRRHLAIEGEVADQQHDHDGQWSDHQRPLAGFDVQAMVLAFEGLARRDAEHDERGRQHQDPATTVPGQAVSAA